jgi:hypothetical protein
VFSSVGSTSKEEEGRSESQCTGAKFTGLSGRSKDAYRPSWDKVKLYCGLVLEHFSDSENS